MSYQGWTNRETWAINIAFEEKDRYEWARMQALMAWRQAKADKTFSRSEQATFGLAERLKANVEQHCERLFGRLKGFALHGTFHQFALDGISDVDWHELAGAIFVPLDIKGYEIPTWARGPQEPTLAGLPIESRGTTFEDLLGDGT